MSIQLKLDAFTSLLGAPITEFNLSMVAPDSSPVALILDDDVKIGDIGNIKVFKKSDFTPEELGANLLKVLEDKCNAPIVDDYTLQIIDLIKKSKLKSLEIKNKKDEEERKKEDEKIKNDIQVILKKLPELIEHWTNNATLHELKFISFEFDKFDGFCTFSNIWGQRSINDYKLKKIDHGGYLRKIYDELSKFIPISNKYYKISKDYDTYYCLYMNIESM